MHDLAFPCNLWGVAPMLYTTPAASQDMQHTFRMTMLVVVTQEVCTAATAGAAVRTHSAITPELNGPPGMLCLLQCFVWLTDRAAS